MWWDLPATMSDTEAMDALAKAYNDADPDTGDGGDGLNGGDAVDLIGQLLAGTGR